MMQIGHALFSLTRQLTSLHSGLLHRRQPCTVIAHPVCPLTGLFIPEDFPAQFDNTFLFPFQFLQPFKLLRDTEFITVCPG